MLKSMKENIINKLPDNNSELSWIIEECGKLLFKNKWDHFRPSQIVHIKYSEKGFQLIKEIYTNYKEEELNDLINYLFSSSLKKLIT